MLIVAVVILVVVMPVAEAGVKVDTGPPLWVDGRWVEGTLYGVRGRPHDGCSDRAPGRRVLSHFYCVRIHELANVDDEGCLLFLFCGRLA